MFLLPCAGLPWPPVPSPKSTCTYQCSPNLGANRLILKLRSEHLSRIYFRENQTKITAQKLQQTLQNTVHRHVTRVALALLIQNRDIKITAGYFEAKD